ncbi:oligosaccharide flippase family protein [Rathayibacter sp. VKM Ac-2803]|uniref:oligosaccharide flippase family protein n=1 Tax=Rathayibacter sp. VKM Ac-2803 TaxID=2609256 RepID=UPI001358E8B3|nr:oligosaccharide flippase family protein [Rathayibacter sp. VKM Ac-2803]MWV49738.1 oligosaccharide flippase family protein [Rathayibacter sp. VKM Ac-2803]
MTATLTGVGRRRIVSALGWSALSTIALRLGSLGLGIVLARILAPEAFGVYALALTVQSVLMALSDFGLSTDLIRSADPERRAPTVSVLGLVLGGTLGAAMAAASPSIAAMTGSPESAGVTAVLAITLPLAGAGVAPYAALQRRFAQRPLFLIAAVDFAVSTTITLSLLAAGTGVLSLAIARVAAQSCTLVLLFLAARERPRFGWDRSVAPSALRFGLPVAIANLISWGVLGTDKVVIAGLIDPVALGYYVLAFNISTWPMTAVGQVVRSVALPAFSRAHEEGRPAPLAAAAGLTWALAAPLGALLAVLAGPLVGVVYGETWAPAAGALALLGFVGALRVVYDLFSSAALAQGGSGRVAVVQGVWLAALTLALVPAVLLGGFVGAAWAQIAVAALVVGPAFVWLLRTIGADLPAIGRSLLPPALASALAAGAAALVPVALGAVGLDADWLALLTGAAIGGLVYLLLLRTWLLGRVRELSASDRRTAS